MLGGGGAYARTTQKQSNLEPSAVAMVERELPLEPELSPVESETVYHPPGIVNRFSRLSAKGKVLTLFIVLMLISGVGLFLHIKANNQAKALEASNTAQQQLLNSLIGKTPTEINTIACRNGISSIDSNTKGGSKGKTVADGIRIFNAISDSFTGISQYAVEPLLTPVNNLALTSREAATSLDQNTAAQDAAGTALIASMKDFAAVCTTLGFSIPGLTP